MANSFLTKCQVHSMEKAGSSTNGAGTTGFPHAKEPSTTHHIQNINLIWVNDPNRRAKPMKFLKENSGKSL